MAHAENAPIIRHPYTAIVTYISADGIRSKIAINEVMGADAACAAALAQNHAERLRVDVVGISVRRTDIRA